MFFNKVKIKKLTPSIIHSCFWSVAAADYRVIWITAGKNNNPGMV
jgi:hypothetical protein